MPGDPVALRADGPAVGGYEVAGDREPEAAARRVGPPVEAVEDAVEVGRRDPVAGVCHRELDPRAVDRRGEAEPPGGVWRIATAAVSAVTAAVEPRGLAGPDSARADGLPGDYASSDTADVEQSRRRRAR